MSATASEREGAMVGGRKVFVDVSLPVAAVRCEVTKLPRADEI